MIVFHMDIMLARRKMSLTELSERVGITIANRAAGHPEPPVRRAGLPARRPDGISAGPAGGMTAPAVAVSAASCYNKGDSAGLTGLK